MITSPDAPGAEQRGTFSVFSGPAPESIASTVFNVTVTRGEDPFAFFGSFTLTLDSAGTSYDVDGDGPVLDSAGTCSYQKTGTNVGLMSFEERAQSRYPISGERAAPIWPTADQVIAGATFNSLTLTGVGESDAGR